MDDKENKKTLTSQECHAILHDLARGTLDKVTAEKTAKGSITVAASNEGGDRLNHYQRFNMTKKSVAGRQNLYKNKEEKI